MDAVLDEARRLGYAEADPSADIDGDDAAAKLVVLAGIAFGRHLPLAAVQFHPESIMSLEGDVGLRLLGNVVAGLTAERARSACE